MWKCCAQMSSVRSAKKKAPAKKSSAKKPAPKKKVAAKKAPAKRAAVKKPAAKKTTKKSTAVAAETETENETVAICRQLAGIVETHTLSEIIIDTPELNLIIRRGDVQPTGIPMMAHMAAPVAHAAPAAAPAAAAPAAAAAAPAVDESLHEVTSPFVGTFYRAPNPDSSSYCEVGQRVEKGQVLCIVEAMKLMNEIEADTAGILEAILVDNAETVEYGQSLFKIRP